MPTEHVRSEGGQTTSEYAVILATIVLAIFGLITLLSAAIRDEMLRVTGIITGG